MFSFQTEPGKLLSDELGKASEARPFPRKKEGGEAYEKKYDSLKENSEALKNSDATICFSACFRTLPKKNVFFLFLLVP